MTEWDGLFRIGTAAILGGVIGFERETLDKPAGLRTHMLVALGSAMFMVISLLIAEQFLSDQGLRVVDPSRIGSTIVTGIGFLCGGLIFRSTDRVHGLTTAAGLWSCGAIGMAVGAGFFVLGVGGTVLTLIVLGFLRTAERYFALKHGTASRDLGTLDDHPHHHHTSGPESTPL